MGAVTLGEAIEGIRDWSMNEGRAAFKPSPGGRDLRIARLQRLGAAGPAAEGGLPGAARHGDQGPLARDVHGGCRGLGAQGLGGRARRVALHPLVPADDRHHRREARLVLRADRRRRLDGRVQRQGAGQGRARRVELPVGRHAQHLRGPRLHRLGSDQPAVAAAEPQLGHAGDPDGVCQLDRRVARQEDAAAPLDGGAVGAGGARAEAVRRAGVAGHRDLRPRTGVLPDRPHLLLQPARPHQRRPDPVRRPAAQGPGAGGSGTSAPSPSACSATWPSARPSSTRSACRSRRGTTKWRRRSTSWRRSSRAPTSPPTIR